METTYPTPIRAGYTYKSRNWDGSYNYFHTSVEIIGETEKSYRVKLLNPVGPHHAGDVTTVRKHNVKFKKGEKPASAPAPEPESKPGREYDYTDAFWNN